MVTATIEAVGVPSTFELTAELARPGGHIANVGVHGQPATLVGHDRMIAVVWDHSRPPRSQVQRRQRCFT